MATPLEIRITELETGVQQQRKLIHTLKATIERHRAVLDVQFRRIADIETELDRVKAAVRGAAPMRAAALIGRKPAKARGRTFAMACVAPSLADELQGLTTANAGDCP